MDYKVMKRPMFKMGGPTSGGTGITSGLETPRQNFKYGTSAEAIAAIPGMFEKTMTGLENRRSALGPMALLKAAQSGAFTGVGGFGDLAMSIGSPEFLGAGMEGLDASQKLDTQIDALGLKEATTMATLLKKKDKSYAMRDNIALSNELNIKKKKLIAEGLSPTSAEVLFLEQQIAKVLSGDTPNEELLNILGMVDDPQDKNSIRRIYEYLGIEPPATIKKAEGGRINKAMGGGMDMGQEQVMPAAQTMAPEPEMMQPQGGGQDMGEDPFQILRARLPREIPDDVVSLIAYNKKAFADFANIQDQDDVDLFNQRYNVQLVVDLASR